MSYLSELKDRFNSEPSFLSSMELFAILTHAKSEEEAAERFTDSLEKKALDALLQVNRSSAIRTPSDLIPFVRHISLLPNEHMLLVTLDGKNCILSVNDIFQGTLNRCFLHCRDIFRTCIMQNASAFILVHNHPSGCADESEHDKEAFKKVFEGSQIIGLQMFDFCIITQTDFNSFRVKGYLC